MVKKVEKKDGDEKKSDALSTPNNQTTSRNDVPRFKPKFKAKKQPRTRIRTVAQTKRLKQLALKYRKNMEHLDEIEQARERVNNVQYLNLFFLILNQRRNNFGPQPCGSPRDTYRQPKRF